MKVLKSHIHLLFCPQSKFSLHFIPSSSYQHHFCGPDSHPTIINLHFRIMYFYLSPGIPSSIFCLETHHSSTIINGLYSTIPNYSSVISLHSNLNQSYESIIIGLPYSSAFFKTPFTRYNYLQMYLTTFSVSIYSSFCLHDQSIRNNNYNFVSFVLFCDRKET